MSTTNPQRRGDLLLGAVLFGLTAIIFLPATLWLVRATLAQEQLYTSLSVLLVLLAIIWRDHDFSRSPAADLGKTTLALLALSFLLLSLQPLLGIGGLIIFAYLSSFAAALVFLMGERFLREVSLISAAFALFTFFVLSIESFDWPLRSMAGVYSGWLLELFGAQVELSLNAVKGEPGLFLISEGRPFYVAAECNGFGMITASALMAVLLALYRGRSALDCVLQLAAGGFIGFVGNTLRIFIIVMLAPHVSNYMLMHEIVGAIALYATLGTAYGLFGRRSNTQQPVNKTVQTI